MAGLAAAGLDPPPRMAIIPATAPPPTAAATANHFLRPGREADFATVVPPLGSATYWKDTVPARACSLEARIRIWNRPGAWLATNPRKPARPPASVMTTSVRSPLTNTPPGPSSGRWKLTAAPGTGLPVSSVISTTIGRLLRDPGRCTPPSPSTTRICRMATWPVATATQKNEKAANRTDLRNKTPLRRTSASRSPELSDFSDQHGRNVVGTARLFGRID